MSVYDKDDFIRVEFTQVCKFCQETGLEWKVVGKKWRLVNRMGHVHSCDNYLTTSAECRCNAEHAHMTYIPHEYGCPAKPRASHPKCQACGDTGVVGVYSGEGEFEFYPCERCGRTNQ